MIQWIDFFSFTNVGMIDNVIFLCVWVYFVFMLLTLKLTQKLIWIKNKKGK